MSTQESNEVHLQILPVLISSLNSKSQKICALFDTLSQSTLIKRKTQATWKQNQNKMTSIKNKRASISIMKLI